MNLLKFIRLLLFPFSLVYWLIVFLRNKAYDANIFKSVQFDIPLICVGNLSVGGTGKTPMVEYLIRLLQTQFETATLSRGYKRRSKGFLQATEHSTAHELGDEPMQLWWKYPKSHVCVGANRFIAIPEMLIQNENIQCILMDDAFQHRTVRAHLNIVLTSYQKLFTDDFYLPTGDLRDWKGAATRATIIVVTKCPENLTQAAQNTIKGQLKLQNHQQLFFSKINYLPPYHLWTKETDLQLEDTEILLISGIANNRLLVDRLTNLAAKIEVIAFADHHYFTERDIQKIKTAFSKLTGTKALLTTEKDAMRLMLHKKALQTANIPIYCLPIEMEFLNKKTQFDETVLNLVDKTFTAYKQEETE